MSFENKSSISTLKLLKLHLSLILKEQCHDYLIPEGDLQSQKANFSTLVKEDGFSNSTFDKN